MSCENLGVCYPKKTRQNKLSNLTLYFDEFFITSLFKIMPKKGHKYEIFLPKSKNQFCHNSKLFVVLV